MVFVSIRVDAPGQAKSKARPMAKTELLFSYHPFVSRRIVRAYTIDFDGVYRLSRGGHIHGSRWTAWLLFSRCIRAGGSCDSIVRDDLCRLLARG